MGIDHPRVIPLVRIAGKNEKVIGALVSHRTQPYYQIGRRDFKLHPDGCPFVDTIIEIIPIWSQAPRWDTGTERLQIWCGNLQDLKSWHTALDGRLPPAGSIVTAAFDGWMWMTFDVDPHPETWLQQRAPSQVIEIGDTRVLRAVDAARCIAAAR